MLLFILNKKGLQTLFENGCKPYFSNASRMIPGVGLV